jgi:hypothetical protein
VAPCPQHACAGKHEAETVESSKQVAVLSLRGPSTLSSTSHGETWLWTTT